MACHASIDKKGGAHDAIVGWGDQIFSTISQKMNELTDFDTIKQIIDATIEEDCYVEECPAGRVRQSNPYFISESNGCGSFGYQWKKDLLPDEGLEDCCNVHDHCYDECGADKDICDLEFKTCLYSVCKSRKHEWTVNELKACKGAAKLMYTATQAFGCKAYQNAQKKACRCVGVSHQDL
ncbi:phospholipase-like protein A2, group [Daphnia pulex]|uniref:Phospholipase-like protein A2, group n=1 Tax=Daphnia pulex TaxID=6669 RepID=E9G470_DAPPU|nr:phospholipase-like protein A2, group [Daphnia pulex]|eukprot:EFX86064.1 phospholipase-like protein A2, group [Daphnia pulex]